MGEFVALVLLGLLVGTLIGGLGGGGGVIAVPLFIWIVGRTPSEAGTLSLIAVAAAAVVAVTLAAIARDVNWPWALVFGGAGLLGSFAGGILASVVDEVVILLAFAVVVGAATIRFLWSLVRSEGGVGDGRPARAIAATSAVGIGAVTGLVGVGGGFLIAPALMRLARLAPKIAIATSSTVILFNSVSSLGARMVLGMDLDWSLASPVLIGAVVGGVVGRMISARASGTVLQYASGGLLVVSCVAVGASLVQAAWNS